MMVKEAEGAMAPMLMERYGAAAWECLRWRPAPRAPLDGVRLPEPRQPQIQSEFL